MKTHSDIAWRSLALAAVLALVGLPAHATHRPVGDATRAQELAELPLDALLDLPVAGASRLGLRMSESAASVTVVTAAEIRALGHRTLADVLRTLRGLSVSDDRSYSYLGVRGFFAPGDYNTRVLLLVDGYRTNDVVYDQAYLGSEFPLDLEVVERVEFIPGQASAVYGANALFGVINVVTRSPEAAGLDGVSLQAGSGGHRQLRIGRSHRLEDGTSVMWSASRLLAEGREVGIASQSSPFAPDGVARDADAERQTRLHLRATHATLSFTALHARRLKHAPVVAGAVFGDPRATNRDEQSMLDLSWTPRFGIHDSATVRGFAGHYRFQGHYSFDHPPVTLNRDDASATWVGAEARWRTSRWTGHRLSVGAEWQRVADLRQRNSDVDPASGWYLDDRRESQRLALFVEDQFDLGRGVELNLAGRVDRVTGAGTRGSQRTALLWRPDPRWVVKLIQGSAWRPPNAFESWYEVLAPGGYRRNPQLSSESVRGSELALEWRPGAADRLSLSLYRNRADRLLVLAQDEADELFQFRNIGTLRARGLELEGERVWPGGARLRANLTLQQAEDADGGLQVARYAPRRMLKLMSVLPLVDELALGTEWRAIARRGDAPGFGTLNLTVSRPLPVRGMSAAVTLRDVFDRTPSDPGPDAVLAPAVPQAGRTLRARLDWAF